MSAAAPSKNRPRRMVTQDRLDLDAPIGLVLPYLAVSNPREGEAEVKDNYVPVHTYLLARQGAPILEVVNLEQLSREQVYEFAFIGAPEVRPAVVEGAFGRR